MFAVLLQSSREAIKVGQSRVAMPSVVASTLVLRLFAVFSRKGFGCLHAAKWKPFLS